MSSPRARAVGRGGGVPLPFTMARLLDDGTGRMASSASHPSSVVPSAAVTTSSSTALRRPARSEQRGRLW